MPQQQTLVTYLVSVAVVAVVILRNSRPQTMTISRLWLFPAILLVLVGFSFWATTVQVRMGAFWMFAVAVVVGAALGIPLGVLRGRHSRVRAGKQPGTIVVEQSPITLMLFLAAFAARYLVKFFVPSAGVGVITAADAFMAFAMTSIVASRYILYTRFRTLSAP